MRRPQLILLACALPAGIFFLAFWLLPALQLLALPAREGASAYFAVLTQPRYLTSMLQTLTLSVVVTLATLVLGAAVGLYLARQRFAGRRLLLAVLTLPLSFPGVIVGFFVILLGGRQGLVADISSSLGGERLTFAYGLLGLFLAYLYFSLPRAIAAYTAAAEAMDPALEEAARSLGASRIAIARDVWVPELAPTTLACGAIVFATAMGAFGTAFTLASKFEVIPITIYDEFTNYANFALAASLSIALGLVTWAVLFIARRFSGEAGA
ncbi:putative spermidine/putrescine transport system permease protein [Pseudacidovorax intermedius]|uniref:Putative spermidine/putrescine transport system permease protein n=1 Tax=Pseudacidovorax intermedius TaxID=433924 RepID=A0A370FLY2_9BURK|nr:ABC transporter permease subunit [Pseudacidovorax intermedius]RDI27389.1 putative spermidine/putrescine transport system permease protein [Pseudacidovorax intermedius]